MKTELNKIMGLFGIPVMVWAIVISFFLHAMLIFGIALAPQSTSNSVVKNLVFEVEIKTNTEGKHDPDDIKVGKSNLSIDAKQAASLKPSAPQLPISSPEFLPSISLRPVADDKFYEAKELDVMPNPRTDVKLEYPKTTEAKGKGGKVNLELYIDENGDVLSLRVIQTTMPGLFDQSAVDAFKHQKFTPGIKGGIPVKSRVVIVVGFRDSEY